MIRLVKAAIMPIVGTAAALAVTRSGATATRVNELGQIEVCAANSPRLDYNPATLACRGLLIEESRINLVLQSQNYGVTWTASSPAPTLSTAAASQGFLALDLLGDTSTSTAVSYAQNVTFTGNAVKAISIFVKKGTAPSSVIRLFDVTAAASRLTAVVSFSVAGVPTASMTVGTLQAVNDYGGGVYRLKFQTTSVTAANTNSLQVYPSADASLTANMTGDIYAGGAQAENAAFSTSYIPSTTGTVTRAADDISDTAIGAWLNTIEGSLVASAMFDNLTFGSDTPMLAALCDNTTSEEVILLTQRSTGVRTFQVADGAVQQASISGAAAAANGAAFTVAACYKANDFAVTADGTAISSDSAGTLPTVTRLRLGSRGAGADFLNGWLLGFSYYGARLSNGDLQTLAAGGAVSATPSLTYSFSGTALAAQTGDLTRTRIAYQTWTRALSATSVTVSSETTDAPRDAPLAQETWSYWKPTAAPATWVVDLGVQRAFDYVLLLGSFGTSAAKIQLEHSDDGSTWRWIVGAVAPVDDNAVLVLFPSQRGRFLRLTLDAIAQVQVVMAGAVLTMERGVESSYRPLPLNRDTELMTPRSRSGQMLGRSIRRKGLKGPVSFSGITPSWYRAYFDPFAKDARTYPFGFAWNPQDAPDDVVFAEADDDIAPQYMADRPLFQMSWSMSGYDA